MSPIARSKVTGSQSVKTHFRKSSGRREFDECPSFSYTPFHSQYKLREALYITNYATNNHILSVISQHCSTSASVDYLLIYADFYLPVFLY